MSQADTIKEFLKWMETCPFPDYEITSMQGKTVMFVKFFLEENKENKNPAWENQFKPYDIQK